MNTERLASPQTVPLEEDVYDPLVWVEAKQVSVARGHLYRVEGRPGRIRDSETMIAPLIEGSFVVLSSYAPKQLEAMRPRGWKRIQPVCNLNEGERLGDILVALKHGANEYTVVSTAVH